MVKTNKYAVSNFIILFFMVLVLGVYSDYTLAQKAVTHYQTEQTDPVGEELNSSSDFSEDEQFKQPFMVCYFSEPVLRIPGSVNKIPITEFQHSFWQPPQKS